MAPSTGTSAAAFPWSAVLHLGFGLLRLAPDIFWSLTLRELMAFGGALRPIETLDRSALDMMMERWPDAATHS